VTISSTTRKAGPFAGDSVQTVFPFVFKLFLTTETVVTRETAGVATVLVNGTDYTVILNSNQDTSPGGNVTLGVALATGSTLVISSGVAALQQVVVTNGGAFFPTVFNAVFDRLTILIQQMLEVLSRSFTVPITATGVTSLEIPVVASGVLQWLPDASGLQAVTLPDLSLSLALPSQAGHANHPLFSNGAVADWRAIAISDVTGLSSSLNYINARASSVPTLEQVRAAAQAAALAEIASAKNFLTTAAVVF